MERPKYPHPDYYKTHAHRDAERKWISVIALIIGVGLLFLKFYAYQKTNSQSIFSDALESIINVVAGIITLIVIVVAAKPADQDHPYGHGKVESMAASFEGGAITLAGLLIILKAVEAFYNGTILKEGSIIKKNDLNNIILDNQKFLQIIFDDTYLKNKIISTEEELEYIVRKLKDKNNKIILTCGCFDILHVGHMHILNQSKKLGDKLIVLLSSDEQIKFLKGINRPINKLEDRLKLFTLVPYVDYVYVYYENLVINNETELDKLMNIVMPDIWTKGDDYNINDIYKKHPSLNKIEIIKRIDGKSTTNIIESCNM